VTAAEETSGAAAREAPATSRTRREAEAKRMPSPPSRRTPSPPLVWFRRTGWRHLVALTALAFALFPVMWVVSAAFSDQNLNSQTVIPENPTLDNFRVLMSEPGHPPFWRWFANSMIVGVVTAVTTVFLCALGAFAFSRLRFRGRRPGLLALLLIQMFPNLLAVVALFLFMTRIEDMFPAIGLGSIWGLILIYLGGALGVNTYLIKGFFDTIPTSLDEAARIDGATHAQTFFRVILPLATPVLAVIALLSFITTQAEFLLADVILGNDEDSRTLAVGLSRYILAGFDNRWGPFAAGALIGAVPVVLLFLFLQRFIVSGLTSGAVKG
jgi:arabinogalactan oligomer/maltooligosaccharide transport system permease protein